VSAIATRAGGAGSGFPKNGELAGHLRVLIAILGHAEGHPTNRTTPW
jgi:hypothetical protein